MTEDINWDELRENIIGLGKKSSRKNYYPELQKKIVELDRFRTLLNQSNEAIFLAECSNGKFIDWNLAATDLLCISTEEIMEHTLFDIIPAKILNPFIDKLRNCTDVQNSSKSLETIINCAKGRKIPVEITIKLAQFGKQEYIVVIARDISERLKIQAALVESESNFREVFDNIYDAIIIHDNNGKIIEVNNKMISLFGVSREDALQLTVEQITDPEEDISRLPLIWDKLSSSLDYVFEWRTKRIADQKRLYVEVALRKIVWNRKTSILAVIRDISERKIAENREKEHRQFLEAMLETIPLPIFYKNINGRYLGCNSSYERYTGFKREYLIGKTASEIFPEEIARVFEQSDIEIVKQNHPQVFETHINDAEGSMRTAIYHKASFSNAQGKTIGFIGAILDITDQKESEMKILASEKKFRNIFNNSNDAIIITSLNTEVLEVNNAFVKLLGYSKEELQKINAINLIDKSLFSAAQDRLSRLIEGELVPSQETELIASDGVIIPVEEISKIIDYENTRAILTVLRDIRERRRFEKRLLDIVLDTEENERRKFAGNLHDEIGPLLSSMKMYISSLEGNEDKKKKEYIVEQILKLIKEAITSIREISNDLSPHVLNNYGLFAAVASAIETKKEFLDISINQNINNIRFPKNLEIIYYRVVKELLNNTLKHASASNVSISIYFEDNKLILKYKDNGIGFDVDKMLYDGKKGIGLLNIISRIRTIGGVYKIVSSAGKGFEFELSAKSFKI
jgi:PAS domain S-box-containing protein